MRNYGDNDEEHFELMEPVNSMEFQGKTPEELAEDQKKKDWLKKKDRYCYYY